jgi:16S rRNA C1402 (ribose-2'-O) methylase RsmI
MIIYESPRRVVKTLEQFCESFGAERRISACREISKIHEESVRGTISEVLKHFKEHEPKGEFVLIVEGNTSPNTECKTDTPSAKSHDETVKKESKYQRKLREREENI